MNANQTVPMKKDGTDIVEFLEELDAGTFRDIVNYELSQGALASIEHGNAAEVTIKISIKQLNSSMQAMVGISLKSKRPKHRGSKTEETTTAAAMHVGKYGNLTYLPENQLDMFVHAPSPSSH